MLPGQQLALHLEVRSAQPSCRVHFTRNLLAKVPNGSQDMMDAVLRSLFVQTENQAVEQRKENVLAFHNFPPEHWRKIWGASSGAPFRWSG